MEIIMMNKSVKFESASTSTAWTPPAENTSILTIDTSVTDEHTLQITVPEFITNIILNKNGSITL
jgi:hypothetical protein